MKIEIGRFIDTSDAPDRDAVHVAIVKAYSVEKLEPGTRVRMNGPGCVVKAGAKKGVGIVDPFLRAPVEPWQTFWVFVEPGTVNNLRHDWDHPDIPQEETASDAEDDYDGCRGC